MEYKIKALDSESLFRVVEFFKTQGYTIYNGDSNAVILNKIFSKGQYDKDNNAYMVYINEKEKLAEKYPTTYLHESKQFTNFKTSNIPFTKEELRILDSYDYDLSLSHIKNTQQNIADWVDSNEI